VDIGDVTVETFSGRERQAFTIRFADGVIDLTLAEVTPAPGHWGRGDHRQPFSVLFEGTPEHVLPQGLWPLDHEELGRIELFLVPLGPEGDVMQYEAVFT
jgi:hypothetical protein